MASLSNKETLPTAAMTPASASSEDSERGLATAVPILVPAQASGTASKCLVIFGELWFATGEWQI